MLAKSQNYFYDLIFFLDKRWKVFVCSSHWQSFKQNIWLLPVLIACERGLWKLCRYGLEAKTSVLGAQKIPSSRNIPCDTSKTTFKWRNAAWSCGHQQPVCWHRGLSLRKERIWVILSRRGFEELESGGSFSVIYWTSRKLLFRVLIVVNNSFVDLSHFCFLCSKQQAELLDVWQFFSPFSLMVTPFLIQKSQKLWLRNMCS